MSVLFGIAALATLARVWIRWEMRHDTVMAIIGVVLAVACALLGIAVWQKRRW